MSGRKTYIKPEFRYWPSSELDAIEAQMSGGGGGGGGGYTPPALGTVNNPVILTPNMAAPTVSAYERWYQCQITGAVDIDASCGSTGQITVKRNGIIPWTFDTIGEGSGQSFSETYPIFGTHTYKVQILTSTYSSKNCTIRQHQDVCPNSIGTDVGALWTHTGGGTMSLIGVVNHYDIVWYVPQDSVSILVDFINSNEYLANMDNLLSGSLSVAIFAATLFPYTPVPVVVTVISGLLAISAYFGGVIHFQQDYIDQIRSCGNYTGTGSMPTYGNGVKLSMFAAAGVGSPVGVALEIESWYGTQMVGPLGETGNWQSNES